MSQNVKIETNYIHIPFDRLAACVTAVTKQDASGLTAQQAFIEMCHKYGCDLDIRYKEKVIVVGNPHMMFSYTEYINKFFPALAPFVSHEWANIVTLDYDNDEAMTYNFKDGVLVPDLDSVCPIDELDG